MDAWGIDVVLTAAQKCFGVPPGLAVLVLSRKAMDKRHALPKITAYYADILRWLPIMKDPSKYFSTPCVNEIRGFCEGTRIILEEGMKKRFNRHDLTGRAIRAALNELGFEFFTDRNFLADTLSVVRYPGGIEDKAFRSSLMENGVVVAGGLGDTAGKVFRMGHMGNLSSSQIYFALEAVEKTLSSLHFSFDPGCGVGAAREILENKE
jgi:aspartate aminotransferase-like enzyme